LQGLSDILRRQLVRLYTVLRPVRPLELSRGFFVTLLKDNAAFAVVEECEIPQNRNIRTDRRPAISHGFSLISDDLLERPGAVKGVPAGTARADP
jgi:hypothetical protein